LWRFRFARPAWSISKRSLLGHARRPIKLRGVVVVMSGDAAAFQNFSGGANEN
jgi:hypothetical protein